MPWRRVAGVVVGAVGASGPDASAAVMEAVAKVTNSVLARNTVMAAPKLEGSMAVPRMEVSVPAGAGGPRVVGRRADGGDDGPLGGG